MADNDHGKLWGMINVPLTNPTMDELRERFAELSNCEPHLGLNPLAPSLDDPSITLETERHNLGEKVNCEINFQNRGTGRVLKFESAVFIGHPSKPRAPIARVLEARRPEQSSGQIVVPGPGVGGHVQGRGALQQPQGGRRQERRHARQARHQGRPAHRGQRRQLLRLRGRHPRGTCPFSRFEAKAIFLNGLERKGGGLSRNVKILDTEI